jgi:RNA polymerase sigma factor (sigma-70 family)
MMTSPAIEACRGGARLSTDQSLLLSAAIEAGRHAASLIETANASATSTHHASDLAQVVADGHAARAIFIEANLGLVITMARRYAGRGVPMADLVQEGTLGLAKAVDRFDHSKGYKFSTYATFWIRQGLLNAMNTARMVRRPAHVEDAIRKIHAVKTALTAELGRTPTTAEVADRTGISERLITRYEHADAAEASLDALTAGQAGSALADTTPDPEAAQALRQVEKDADLAVLRQTLAPMLGRLSEREQAVVTARFGLGEHPPMTVDATATLLGVDRHEVRRTELVAIAKMRQDQAATRVAAVGDVTVALDAAA